MIENDLRDFIESAIGTKYISDEDVNKLQRDILRGGLKSRVAAEALLASTVRSTARSASAATRLLRPPRRISR